MLRDSLEKALRFYFITDDSAPDLAPLKQVEIALAAGATMVQYRNKAFSPRDFQEALGIRNLCKCNGVPFIVNDDLLLAKAVASDGVHLGQEDEDTAAAREILGREAIVGTSVSTRRELEKTDLTRSDYIGTGPVFATQTKADAKSVIGLSGLQAVTSESPVPVVAIGGIDAANAESCFKHGAAGVSVISCISRARNPEKSALELGLVCGSRRRDGLEYPWKDEFGLIEKLLKHAPPDKAGSVRVAAGDDAALLGSLSNPVITTDSQKEGVHFHFEWQTPEEVGFKAVEITLSDLAASYATPKAVFINLGLPSTLSEKTVEQLYAGVGRSLAGHGCALGGGNISGASQLSIDLFAVGEGHDGVFPRRSEAQAGDGLYCTGPLGLARAGLETLMRKDASFMSLVEKFKSPRARFDAARILAENGVRCVTDVSDGLAGDARHIAEASNLTIEFDLASCPIDEALLEYCSRYNQVAENLVLAGGEDYELLFACDPEIFAKIRKDVPEAFQAGRCVAYSGQSLSNLPPGVSSFQHGADIEY